MPEASGAAFQVQEDHAVSAFLQGSDLDGDPISFRMVQLPSSAHLALDAQTGQFRLVPEADFNGLVEFTFATHDGKRQSTPARVTVRVDPVDDAPRLAVIPDQRNSPDQFRQAIAFSANEVDGDHLRIEASLTHPDIAELELDAAAQILYVTPLLEGATSIVVVASDGTTDVQRSFQFEVGNVQRRVRLAPASLAPEAVRITNPLAKTISFTLNVNGRLHPGTAVEIAERMLDMNAEGVASTVSADALPRQLWAGVASAALRGQTYSDLPWVHDPVILLNSLGVGYCDDFASAYYGLATLLGLEARVWSLGGHVVPEVYSDGGWRVYDPDLGVYYETTEGAVAGVEQLAADSSLITAAATTTELKSATAIAAHSQELADVYATTNDNEVWEYYMEMPNERRQFSFELPSGASLEFPGRYTSAPLDLFGLPMQHYANLKLTLPGSWAGTVRLPLVLVAAGGSGTVLVGNDAFGLGSPELQHRLADRSEFIDEVTIAPGGAGAELVYLLTPATVVEGGAFDLEMRGTFAAGLEVSHVPLPAGAAVAVVN